MDPHDQILDFGQRARQAARALAKLGAAQKNAALRAMADEVAASGAVIMAANEKDLARARANALPGAMIDRLTLNAERLEKIADGIRAVAALPDPVGEVLRRWTQPNGIEISIVRVPIGVIGIIYESRPNVTSDAAVLCTKTGNATILRGGSESIHSNVAIAEALQRGGTRAGLPPDSILLIPQTDREAVRHMAEMDRYIDLIIPRGGHALIEAVVSHARMPVIKHAHGVCIIYVDQAADLQMATEIIVNAKTQRPGVCNAAETVLVHRAVAPALFKKLVPRLAEKNVELRADAAAFSQLAALDYRSLWRTRPIGRRSTWISSSR